MLATVDTDLAHVRPPSAVKTLHQKLIGEIAEFRGEFVGMIHSLQANDMRDFMVETDMRP
jgi:hypothetical protein